MNNRDIDQIIAEFVLRHPSVSVTQLKASHPADDDGIWFFRLGASEIQIESSTGNCPFLIESNTHLERVTVTSVSEVMRAIVTQLGLPLDLPPRA